MSAEPTPPCMAEEPAETRKPWTPPRVAVMRAGEAEAGPDPINPEGAFGMGS